MLAVVLIPSSYGCLVKTIKTKILSGKLKGRVFSLPNTPTTRPTKSIVKESFFNTIGSDIYDYTFIECFLIEFYSTTEFRDIYVKRLTPA